MNDGSKDFTRWKANAQGIDPNRNYDVDWKKIQNSPTNPSWRNHKGTKPAQIAEVKAVMKVVDDVNPEMILDYHSSGEVLFWDYKIDYKNKQRDRVISNKVTSMTGYSLMFAQNRATGSLTDWFMYRYDKPALTPEVGKFAGQTNVPLQEFDRIWKHNAAVPMYAAMESRQLWTNKQPLVQLRDVQVDLLKPTTLYTQPFKPTKQTIQPQRVSAVGEKADWYVIRTDKGNRWIKKQHTQEYTVHGFTDYKEGAYWSEPTLWAVNKGLVAGNVVNERKYLKPMDDLTEAQFLTILFRYAKPEELATTAPTSNYWAAVPYQLAAHYNLPVAGSLAHLKPANDPITRGEMAQILAALHFGDPTITIEDSVAFMYESNISAGYDPSNQTLANFGVDQILKRGHISTFFMNYDTFLQNEAHNESTEQTEE